MSEVKVFCCYDKMVNISELIENPRNPNTHPEEQLKKLAKIISHNGWRAPITVSKRSGFIVKGHGRLAAAKLLGLKTVPVDFQDYENESLEYADLMADNRIAEEAEMDNKKLLDLFQEFDTGEVDFDLSGYDEEFYKNLASAFDEYEPTELLGDPDEVPEEVETRCKRGDIWQLGNHRLMCGDSTVITDVEKLMNGEKADMVFTDPPYGYEYQSNHQEKRKYDVLKNDDKILDYINSVYNFIEENCAIFSFCGWQSLKKWLDYFDKTKLTLKNIIIWKKNNWSMGDLTGAFAGQYEIILFLTKGRIELKGKRDSDIWEFDREPPKMHPTMKPIELISYAINKTIKRNDIVLDVFGGSGSTLIACEQLSHKCYMMELDEHYCDVIITRWENLTGKTAQRINE